MRALAIDTSTETAGVALCDGAVCAARTASGANAASLAAPGQHGERLLGIIDALLHEAEWKRRDLELVACCLGPGSFTGVRVGLATAKGIALALGLPIVGVGSLEVMASLHFARLGATAQSDEGAVALLDARKGEVFWAAYASDGALIAGPGHVAAVQIGDIRGRIARPKLTFLGEVARRLPLDPAHIATAPETDRPDPVHLARLGMAMFERRGPDDLDALEPTYVRPPDITLPAGSS
ncbi:MAG TPA: tRNA (adenosine(37)-N6)-threonylcarbamoyltransferase complex dimerization subunit type 1 TsaB [Polyangiaceae bacterium]|nr:tRNA (adenosine(37)-N6)-threonylcarbamoyltransferase complex dimerization subunit type 1 TsaB [Polyangiaceae bacterium]